MDEVETIERGCPFCNGDVKGDDESKYLCPKCNLLYTREDLEMRPA